MKNIQRTTTTIIAFLMVIFSSMPVLATVPTQISFQGRLNDAAGTPVADDVYAMRFYLFDSEIRGSQLWNSPNGEEQSVAVADGIYSVRLGQVQPLAASVFSGGSAWLEVAIRNSSSVWETLSPRQLVTSTAYALKAGDADTLAGQTLVQLDSTYVNVGETAAVTSAMIADNSINTADLANNAVSTVKIADSSITANKIDTGAINGSKIADGSITAADLAEHYVRTTGDSMTGDLVITGDITTGKSSTSSGDYAAVFQNSGGTYAHAIKGAANASNNALGLQLDVSSASQGAYGSWINATAGSGSASNATGSQVNATHYGTGPLYGLAIDGNHNGSSGDAAGLYSFVYGSDTGMAYGVHAGATKNNSTDTGFAYGGHFTGTNNGDAVNTYGQSYGVFGEATGASDAERYGVYGKAVNPTNKQKNYGVYAEAASWKGMAYGIESDVTLVSEATVGYGAYFKVYASPSADTCSLHGATAAVEHRGTSGSSYGLAASVSPSATGDAYGIASSVDATRTSGNAYGIYSSVSGTAANDYAGYFSGNVHVAGNLSKTAGSFKIDHPLDPENKYLQHSFVESPDMLNVYNGNAILDGNGEVWVNLPEYFEALNKDFRYQVTCIGGFAPVYIAEEIAANRFKIAGGSTGIKVSWQVTGIRRDAWAESHRIKVEEDKVEKEKGSYLTPEAHGQPASRSVEYARHPDLFEKHQGNDKKQKTGAE